MGNKRGHSHIHLPNCETLCLHSNKPYSCASGRGNPKICKICKRTAQLEWVKPYLNAFTVLGSQPSTYHAIHQLAEEFIGLLKIHFKKRDAPCP